MDQLTDVVIVSIFGRGNWLASELAIRGWKVTLIDASDRMGEWEPEDCEGPFGLLESSDLVPTQKTRLTDEGEALSVPQGFTLWLKDGPLECKSEMTQFHLGKYKISRAVEAYLRMPGLPSKESERERRAMTKMTFEENWLAQFAHQIASHTAHENHLSLETAWPLPVFSPFMVRQVTKAGWQKGLKACQSNGVTVRAHAGVRDLRLSDRLVDAIEVEDERSGIERGRSFVWMLSSAETAMLKGSMFKTLYSRGEVEPSWYWARFQVDLEGRVFEEQLPLHSVVIEDVFLPWTHTNTMVVRKRVSGKSLDVWVRLPIWARFDHDYRAKIEDEVLKILRRRLPQSEPRMAVSPPESRYSIEKLGPPRFPIYSRDKLNRLNELKTANLFFDGPEHWETLDWLGQFRHQNELLGRLEKLKAQWDAEALRHAMANQRSPSP